MSLPEFPGDQGAIGPYVFAPARDDEAIARAILAGLPESIPGLSQTKPDFAVSGHRIVRSFALDGKQRPSRECVPCAICGPHPKFLEGAVLWSPDRWLRLIGHQCAANPEHFGQAEYERLQKEHDQRELDDVALRYLETNLPNFRPMLEDINAIRSVAVFVEEQQRLFFRKVPALADVLAKAAKRSGGSLTVEAELSSARLDAAEPSGGRSQGAAQSCYETVRVGTMRGLNFVIRPSRKLSSELDAAAKALEGIQSAGEDEPLLRLIEQGISTVAGDVRRSLQSARRVAERLAEARHFVSGENLEAIRVWGADIRNIVQFSIQQIGSSVRFVTSDKDRFILDTKWPPMPDLKLLEQLVAAGNQLDE